MKHLQTVLSEQLTQNMQLVSPFYLITLIISAVLSHCTKMCLMDRERHETMKGIHKPIYKPYISINGPF